jgi:hypothetical protein
MSCYLKHTKAKDNLKSDIQSIIDTNSNYDVIIDKINTIIDNWNKSINRIGITGRSIATINLDKNKNKNSIEIDYNDLVLNEIDEYKKFIGIYESKLSLASHFKDEDNKKFELLLNGEEKNQDSNLDQTKETIINNLFNENESLANAVYEALGFEIPTTKLQGKQFEYGEPRFFDVVEELTSGERASLPSSILINKLLKGEYLPEIKESQIILGLSEAGIWRPNIKKIEASGENKSTLAKKIGHELLHSVTSNIILSYQNLKGTVDFTDKYYKDFIRQGYIKPVDLSKSQIEALDNLVRIRNKVISYVEQNKDKIQKQDRGFGTYDYFIRTNYTESETDLHEFISEVFTNPELINILKEIPTEGKKSKLFKDFVDAIAKILGFTNTSILEDIIAYSEEAFFTQPQITPQQKQQALQLYSQYLESLNKPNTNPILQGNQTNIEEIITHLEKDKLLEIDCKGKLKAEKGLATSFTKGGKWEIYEIFEGKSHKQGGIDINIKNNQISFTNKNGSIKAKYGLVIPKDN